ncbi:DUF2141 domain-containing protein [Leptolyngbyaceae cyanobacterium CCMR0082]|uniref:DUF2141 domain-containing protein n=2 Tax=Adonisia turfae TaxID=2950184 RepID=A0A6M0SG36_9CYAN|nr:DUF2141 domain-containing protein [Adonisia turfae]MDV3348703.1 DUF2141 domain-containing protein [Leptothoe sp. LEGE 181152]NEZ54501.1 DUF2141 domain-containing protein [Adonisia turfae CCMR0081]NEZ66933.1 DUF2141 domain-containing protein [Adonisia turfae CCMR0082]
MHNRHVVAGVLMMTTVGSLAYPAHGQLEHTQLAVEISGVNTPQGQVCLNLFNSSDGFPGDREEALESLCLTLTEDSPPVATFENLAPGSYAVSVFHDANNDNEFNRNFVGMPAEGFGFSRNPEALTGPPEFGDAVFLVAGAENRIEVELSYF